MIKYAVLKRKEIVIVVLLTAIIFFTHTIYVKDTGIVFILPDEYGYWASAAYFSGLDWSATVSKLPYYSYGYSLLLFPLFSIFENTTTMYQAAILMNGIMVSISFLLCYDIAKKLMSNNDEKIVLSISFLVSMYPTYIVYSHTTWNECLLMFIFWLLTWCYVNLNKQTSTYKFLIIGILSSLIYIVHQRALGILVASIIVITIMKISNKISINQFLSFIIPIIVMMVLHINFKDNIQSNLWLNGSEIAANDYSGQLNKVNQVFSVEGLTKLGKILVGHLFYIGAATFLIAYFGIFEITQNIFRIIKHNRNNDLFYFYLFLLVSFVFTITISSIFFINPGRIDQIVYGRYNEIIVGPVMLLGFAKLTRIKSLTNKKFISLLLIFFIHTAITYYIIKISGLIKSFTIQTIALRLMNTEFGVFLPAIISVIFLRLIWISFQNKNTSFIIITIVLISIVFCSFGIIGAKLVSIQQQDMLEILKVTDKIISDESLPIYFLLKDPDKYEMVEWNGITTRDRSISKCYQFILKDKKIKPISLDELKIINEEKFVITTSNMINDYLLDNYFLIENDNGSYLYKTK